MLGSQKKMEYLIRFLLDGYRESTESVLVIRVRSNGINKLHAPFVVTEIAPLYTNIDENFDTLLLDVECFISEFLKDKSFVHYLITNSYNNVQIIFCDASVSAIESLMRDLRIQIELKFGLESFIGIGETVNKLTEICSSASNAHLMLAYKHQYAEQGVLSFDKTFQYQDNSFDQDIVFERVIGCFLDCDLGRMSVRLDELVEHIRHKPNVSLSSIRRSLIELTVRIINIASNAGVDVDSIIGDVDIYHWILSQDHTEIITSWILDLSAKFMSTIKESESTVENRIIKKANLYIERNLVDNSLGLQAVSEYVNLTPSYFSQLFKDKTGKGINAYIVDKRIDRAKYLLKHTALDISDIAKQCGFSTSQYFSKVFKLKTDSTPLAFRKS